MPMVNSFGATKKAPYTAAPNIATTAAAPRSFAVIYVLSDSYVLCFEQIRAVFTANPLLSHRFTKPRGRGYPAFSFLQEIFPEKPYGRQKNHVERDQERQPVPAKHRILRKQRSGSLRAGDQQRRQQWQQQQWKQQLAHTRLRRNRRQCRTGHRKPQATQEQHQRKLRHNSKQRHVVQYRENRQQQQLRDQQEKRIGAQLGQKNCKRIGNRKAQRA